jgi:transcriptional regulator with XRE-family HTH domain
MPELGAWLRQQREIRGWARPEMARQLIQAGRTAGDKSMPGLDSMCHNLYRWERGADSPSERYRLYYSRVLGISPSQFGADQYDATSEVRDEPPRGRALLAAQGTTQAALPAHTQCVTSGAADASLSAPAVIAYRGVEEPGTGRFHVEREVLMAAHEGSDHAEEFEPHGIGDATFEQLRADVVRLSRLCDTGPPLEAFLDMRRVRSRVYRLLDRRLWPREQADLFFLLGCISGLMGVAAGRLGYPDAAEELIRAGWAYANAIDHGPLRGMLRVKLSANMYWRGWYSESRDLATDGLQHVTRGPLAADLHLNYARASARLGEPDGARRAVGLARDAHDSGYSDDLVEIGGEEFRLTQATQHTMAAHAFVELSDGDREAVAELERAISLYDEGPVSGQRHWFGGRALAGADLALVRLRSGALDAAVAALQPLLVLPPAQRVNALSVRLTRVRDELAAAVFRGSPEGRDLDQKIEEFGREAVTAGLHTLAGGPG